MTEKYYGGLKQVLPFQALDEGNAEIL